MRDLESIAEYIAQGSTAVADAFLMATSETIGMLAASPFMGRKVDVSRKRLRGPRRWTLLAYPNYNVYYLPRRSGIVVVRVLHGARDTRKLFGR